MYIVEIEGKIHNAEDDGYIYKIARDVCDCRNAEYGPGYMYCPDCGMNCVS